MTEGNVWCTKPMKISEAGDILISVNGLLMSAGLILKSLGQKMCYAPAILEQFDKHYRRRQ